MRRIVGAGTGDLNMRNHRCAFRHVACRRAEEGRSPVAAYPSRADDGDTDPRTVDEGAGPPPDVLPKGEVYDWYTRGVSLLEGGDSAAAVVLLTHVAEAEPMSRSVREALARSQF